MNYDRIILELMDRIQALEEKVATLENGASRKISDDLETMHRSDAKIGKTQMVKEYIRQQKKEAARRGEKSVVLNCNDIRKATGLTINDIPIIAGAMHRSRNEKDEILCSSPSGMTTRLTILYYIEE